MNQSRREFLGTFATISGAAYLSTITPSFAFADDLSNPDEAALQLSEVDPTFEIESAQGTTESLPTEISWPYDGNNNPSLTVFDVPEGDPNYGEFQRMKEHLSQDSSEKIAEIEQGFSSYSAGALTPIPREDVVLRLAILSDTHSGYYGRLAIDKLNNALNIYRNITPDVDALFILGDLVCLNTQEEILPILEEVIRPLDSRFSNRRPFHLLMGNHDFLGDWHVEGFEATYGRYLRHYRDPSYPVDSTVPLTEDYGQQQNVLFYLANIPIIKLCPQDSVNSYDYRYLYRFLEEKLALARAHNADLAKPILVMAHHPMQGLWFDIEGNYGYYGVGSSQDMVELLAQYPEVVFLAGHTHNALQMPQSINQDPGFTTINTATAGAALWSKNDLIEHGSHLSQGILLDIFPDNKVRVTRIEFGLQQYLGATWEFYPADAATRSAPFLTAPRHEAARRVAHTGFANLQLHAAEASFIASFNQGVHFSDDENAFIYRYRLDITDPATGSSFASLYRFSDFFNRDMASTFELSSHYRIGGGTWRIKLTALNPYDDAVGTLRETITLSDAYLGWVAFPGGRRYYPSLREAATGWRIIDGAWYYFDTGDAWLQHGWLYRGSSWYYLDPTDGHMIEGWRRVGNRWYYLKPGDGFMLEGWQWLGGRWYYLKPGDGFMLEGWQQIGSRWYYLKPGDGSMLEGWLKVGESWYYLKPGAGFMLEGWQWLGGCWYYLKPGSGNMLAGWQQIGSRWYYLRPEDGHMLEGWQQIAGRWYYLKPSDGYMLEGWLRAGEGWYYLKPGDGYMLEGWLHLSGAWYYLQAGGSGRMLTGSHTIEGRSYTFSASGALAE